MLTPGANPSLPALQPISRASPSLSQDTRALCEWPQPHSCYLQDREPPPELAGKTDGPWGGESCPEGHRECAPCKPPQV